jgi:hypothetical protein
MSLDILQANHLNKDLFRKGVDDEGKHAEFGW